MDPVDKAALIAEMKDIIGKPDAVEIIVRKAVQQRIPTNPQTYKEMGRDL